MRTVTLRTVTIGVSILSFLAFGTENVALGVILQPGAPMPGNPDFTFTFDEQGHGIINGQQVPWGVAGGGGIDYVLPVPVVPGDVIVNVLSDVSPNNPNGFSDLMTFFNIQTPTGGQQGVLFYQSLLDDSEPPDPADVLGLVAPTTPFFVLETGPEGNNGFAWNPFVSNTFYNGVSDGIIPEPSSFILGGMGLIALALMGWRRIVA